MVRNSFCHVTYYPRRPTKFYVDDVQTVLAKERLILPMCTSKRERDTTDAVLCRGVVDVADTMACPELQFDFSG